MHTLKIMKTIVLPLSFAAFCNLFAAAEPLRETIDFDFGWRYARGPIDGATEVDHYDGDPLKPWLSRVWSGVDLPHDFQFEYPWDARANRSRGFKAMGEGIYRKRFLAEPGWKGKRVAIDFGGILCLSKVYLNGELLAENDYGYLGFEVPLEDRLRFGETNVIAVIASTGRNAGGRWYTGGGLYRSVKLVVRDPVSISRHGVFVTTPKVNADRAEVAVQVDVDGWMRRTNDLQVVVTVAGQTVRRSVPYCRMSRATVDVPRITVEKPDLWSIDRPALYTAEVMLVKDGVEVDRVSRRFGIRTVEFDAAYGFKLNGRKVFLKGMSNHHDLGALGAAAYRRAIRRQIETMKRFGYNAIRCSHNPYSEDLYDLADEMGLLVVDELVDKWGRENMCGRPMCECFFDRITEWVRRDRNHPSVILWSLGNEMQHNERVNGVAAFDWGVTQFKLFDTVVRRWDPTRKTTAAMYPAAANGITWEESKTLPEEFKEPPELCRLTDVASINYCWNRYADFVARVPHMNIFQSEATVRECLAPFWAMDRDHTVGLSYWGAIAYWGESGGWPRKGWDYSFFDHDLRPRPTAWLIRTAFVPDEMQVRVAVDQGQDKRMWNDVLVGQAKLSESWNCHPGKKVNLAVFTNCREAELFLNGRSLGVRKNDATGLNDRNVLKWKGVEWEAGTLEAVGRVGEQTVRHRLETTGEPVRLVAVDETPGWVADGHDLKYLRINAVDAEGRVVPDAVAKVKVVVKGPARLLALDDGDQSTDLLFDTNEKPLRNGSLLVILRAGRTPGEVTVTAQVEPSHGEEVLLSGSWVLGLTGSLVASEPQTLQPLPLP